MMYAQFITKGCLEVDRLVHLFYGNHVWARIKFPLLMLSAFVWYSIEVMAIRVVEFSNWGYKIRNIFA